MVRVLANRGWGSCQKVDDVVTGALASVMSNVKDDRKVIEEGKTDIQETSVHDDSKVTEQGKTDIQESSESDDIDVMKGSYRTLYKEI